MQKQLRHGKDFYQSPRAYLLKKDEYFTIELEAHMRKSAIRSYWKVVVQPSVSDNK